MKRIYVSLKLLLAVMLIMSLNTPRASALPVQTMAPITGEIQAITLTTPADVWSGGTMTVGGQVIILPANLLINLPNDYQSLQQLFTNAPPACLATSESGLAKSDRCNQRATGAQVVILANRTDSGNIIAGQVDIFKAVESVQGNITYIDTTGGYFRVNGISGDASTGAMVRVNDPTSRHTIQSGLGCAIGSATVNCSPDTRFKIDPDNYTFCYITGYPACIQTSTDPTNVNCPGANRPAIAPIISSNPFAAPPVAADSRHFAPLQLGDPVKADGNFETVGGVTFLSASSVRVMVDLSTNPVDPTQPNYLIINAADWDGPAYPAGRVRGRLLTNSSIHDSEIDFYSVHYDPVNNAPHERILYTTRFNKQYGVVVFNVPTGVSDSQIRYDFMPGAPVSGVDKAGQEPCASLWGTEPKSQGSPVAGLSSIGINVSTFCPDSTGLGLVDNFNLMAPIFREVMARSTRSEIPVGAPGHVTGVALDIQGRPTQSGFYKLPTSIAYGAFEDINLGMGQFPVQFSGNPWLLDRRLSPNGCVGPCGASQQPLTPFPFEGIDPRLVAPDFGFCVGSTCTTLPTPNRMLTFMTAAGSMTGLLSWPPTNPGAFPIVATPPFSLFPPFADEDSAVTTVGVPVIIPVLANDVSVFGTIDTATVKIPTLPAPSIFGTLPSGATVQVNPSGTITYTPAPTFFGPDTFTYTVANNFGSVSLPGTINVTVAKKPSAANDAVSTPAKSVLPINVVANDIAGTSLINLASVNITSGPTCGSLVNQVDGIVVFTAPNAVPAAPGTCSFSYVVSDTSVPPLLSNVATVTVTITPALAPVAGNDAAATTAGSPININVIANDTSSSSSINPASLSVTLPTGGSAVPNANGTVTYMPPATPGSYTFTYTVQDNSVPPLTSNVATVAVTVTAAAPVANNDTGLANLNSSVTINVIANDFPGTNPINASSVAIVSAPLNGTAVANAGGAGTIVYTPTAAFTGTDSFIYNVRDSLGNVSNSAVVIVTVAAPAILSINGGPAFFTNVNNMVLSGIVASGSQVVITTNTSATAGPVSFRGLGGTTWSSSISSLIVGTNNITVTATDSLSNQSVQTATITYDVNPFVMRLSDTLKGSVIQPLYDTTAAVTDTIQLRLVTLAENPVFDRAGVTMNLNGGYDNGFAVVTGVSTIMGSMTVRQGTVRVNNLVIR